METQVLTLTPYQELLLMLIDKNGYTPDFGEESEWRPLVEAGLVKPSSVHHEFGRTKWIEAVYVRGDKRGQL